MVARGEFSSNSGERIEFWPLQMGAIEGNPSGAWIGNLRSHGSKLTPKLTRRRRHLGDGQSVCRAQGMVCGFDLPPCAER